MEQREVTDEGSRWTRAELIVMQVQRMLENELYSYEERVSNVLAVIHNDANQLRQQHTVGGQAKDAVEEA